MSPRRVLAGASLMSIAILIAYLLTGRDMDAPDQRSPNRETKNPSSMETPSRGRDIGLGFRICRVAELQGLDLGRDMSSSTAWTATDMRADGRCNRSSANSFIVAVDVDGDGLADASSKPLRYCFYCRPVAATDVDGDGDRELLVLEQGGSVSTYAFYDIETTSGEAVVRVIPVAEAGHRTARHAPGQPLRFWVGGDEGYSAAAACTGYPGRPQLVVTWSNHPIEGRGSETTEVHVTTLQLRQGAFHVVAAVDTQEPTDGYDLSGLERSRDVCGIDLSGGLGEQSQG